VVLGQTEPDTVESADLKSRVQTRLNALKSLPVEDIEAAVLRSEQAMQELNKEAQASRLTARKLQEKMRLENVDVRAMYKEIDLMRLKINEFIDQIPEVKEQLETVRQTEAKLMEEIWFRTGVRGLAAKKDREMGLPDRPEILLDKSDISSTSEQKKDLEP